MPLRFVVLLLLLAACAACSTPVADEPDLSDSTLVDVLIELELAVARIDLYGDLDATTRDSILWKYGLDSTRFDAIMAYYAAHPDAYLELQSKLLDRLSDERFEQE